MKPRFYFIILFINFILLSCSSSDQPGNRVAIATASRHEILDALAQRDSLIILSDYAASLADSIKTTDRRLAAAAVRPSDTSARIGLLHTLESIDSSASAALSSISSLESSLAESQLSGDPIIRAASNVHTRLYQTRTDIRRMKDRLVSRHSLLQGHDRTVDSLKRTVATVASRRDSAIKAADTATDRLNTCYFIAASKDILKKHGILKTRFLRSSLVLPDGFDTSAFTRADKRRLRSISVSTHRLNLLSNHPSDSYEIADDSRSGRPTLRILDSTRFWSLTNYLIIRTD